MKHLTVICILFVALAGYGQQTPVYSQYTFNKAGMNPAASGTEINRKYYFVMGLSRPWTEIDNPPRSTFANFSYTIRQPRSLSFWQNVSALVEAEEGGLIGSTNLYLGYTMHFLLRKKLVLSAGIYAGARNVRRSIGFVDQTDPAIQRTTNLLLYPDVIPGIRLSDKSFFFDLSVRQISIMKLQDFSGQKIGSPSRLSPTIYMDYGKKIAVTTNVLMMPSVAMHIPLVSPPLVEGTLMFYAFNRVGGGVALRNLSFATGILQVRFLENITAGFAYSYPINSTRFAQGHTYEFMIGVIPTGMDVKVTGRHSVAKCPTLEF
jgi:type IX secretion system PorP/SprF family membrane protein